MEFFFDQLRLVLPILGFNLFQRPVHSDLSTTPRGPEGTTFTFATAGALATARETEEGFVVLAGSTARRTPTETFPAGYLALRDQIIADGKLAYGPTSDLYTFSTDVVFTSPSAAAAIVAARSASGPREWKVEGIGQLYKDWKATALEQG
jgi:hypothetical protein